MRSTLHEEMLDLASHLQEILLVGYEVSGLYQHHSLRQRLVSNLAGQLTEDTCPRDTKLQILKMLQLTIVLQEERDPRTNGYIGWPVGEKSTVIEEMQADEVPHLGKLQRQFCIHIRDSGTGINCPAILIRLIGAIFEAFAQSLVTCRLLLLILFWAGSETQDVDLVSESFNLAIVLLSGGNKTMQGVRFELYF